MSLYRKYRPASFAEVIGQEHVTDPLGRAIDAGRIHHAFLFSGPRGCGKTSSARILARSLNCERGPTSTPCGICDSCIQLAPGGSGNLDVVELDAASHGGVDDTRDLRDRAFYAPVSSRYRVFIIDEAHMVSTAGFNALLKIVEEPPEHVIFIFATTEPEKVIPTIRSRTHHYPFRLLGPKAMDKLITYVLTSEAMTVEKSVYPLLIRAGGGSPRDTLSLLDQLIAGAPDNTVSLEHAATLLGVTDTELLDELIIAISQKAADTAFTVVEKILDSGLDPRRFVLDLLERHRDLLLIQSIPDAVERGILPARSDTTDTLRELARTIPSIELVHNAEVLTEGLSGLRGTTAPRLLLEIMIARLLLVHTTTGLETRISIIENLVGLQIPASVSTLGRNKEAVTSVSQIHDDKFSLIDSPAPETIFEQKTSVRQSTETDLNVSDPATKVKFFRKSQGSNIPSDAEDIKTNTAQPISNSVNDSPLTDEYSSVSATRSYNSVRKPQEVRAQFTKNPQEDDEIPAISSVDEVILQADDVISTAMQNSELDADVNDLGEDSGGSNSSDQGLSKPAMLTVEHAYELWPAIRKKIHDLDKVIEVMLASSEVIRVDFRADKPVIVLEHESAPLLNRLNSERGTSVLRKAAEEIIGYPVDVITELKKKSDPSDFSGSDSRPKVQTGVEPEKIQPRVAIFASKQKKEPEYFGYEDEIVITDRKEEDAVEILHRILGARQVD